MKVIFLNYYLMPLGHEYVCVYICGYIYMYIYVYVCLQNLFRNCLYNHLNLTALAFQQVIIINMFASYDHYIVLKLKVRKWSEGGVNSLLWWIHSQVWGEAHSFMTKTCHLKTMWALFFWILSVCSVYLFVVCTEICTLGSVFCPFDTQYMLNDKSK